MAADLIEDIRARGEVGICYTAVRELAAGSFHIQQHVLQIVCMCHLQSQVAALTLPLTFEQGKSALELISGKDDMAQQGSMGMSSIHTDTAQPAVCWPVIQSAITIQIAVQAPLCCITEQNPSVMTFSITASLQAC